MNKVQVLIEGYARTLPDETEEACGTTTLITTTDGKQILTDPGSNPKLLLEKLQELAIEPKDVEWVFLTHHHLDHSLNLALFPNAKVVDNGGIYFQDKISAYEEVFPGTDLKILQTPGHEDGSASLVVETEEGIFVIAGDVFWWADGEEQVVDIEKEDPYATNMEALKESRKKVLEIADFIIPGHGKRFTP